MLLFCLLFSKVSSCGGGVFRGGDFSLEVSPTLNGFLALFLHKKRAAVSGVALSVEVGLIERIKINYELILSKKFIPKKTKTPISN